MVKSGTIRLVSAIVCNALVLYVQQKPSIKPHIYHIYESLIVFLKSVPFWSPCTGVASFWKPIVSIVLEGLVQESFFQGHLSSKNSYSPELTGLHCTFWKRAFLQTLTCPETLLLYVEAQLVWKPYFYMQKSYLLKSKFSIVLLFLKPLIYQKPFTF